MLPKTAPGTQTVPGLAGHQPLPPGPLVSPHQGQASTRARRPVAASTMGGASKSDAGMRIPAQVVVQHTARRATGHAPPTTLEPQLQPHPSGPVANEQQLKNRH